MPESQFPLLFFPAPKLVAPLPSNSRPRSGDFKGFQLPSRDRQIERLDVRFTELDRVFANQTIQVTASTDGILPEAVLVVKTKGCPLDFQLALRNTEMEWLAEFDFDAGDPDGDFFYEASEKKVPQHLVFSFTNQTAKQELLSLWNKWKSGISLPHGKTEWEKIFAHLDEIRPWGLEDRLNECDMLQFWKQELDDATRSLYRFEIEFWFRKDERIRNRQIEQAQAAITAVGGRIIGAPCVIADIDFCAVKAELPKDYLRKWIALYERDSSTALGPFESQGIRCLRPSGCSVTLDVSEAQDSIAAETDVLGDPLVAILDGVPMSNHALLKGRVEVYDPDDFADKYGAAAEMRHGTSMCSLVSLGELDAQTPLKEKVICRPILQPDSQMRAARINNVPETIPDESFPEDIVWRAVHELLSRRRPGGPAAPNVRIINLSVGDGAKPFLGKMSSWARVLDYLAWKFHVLFIVASGNCTELPMNIVPSILVHRPESERRNQTLQSLLQHTKERSILSPAESVNAITVGVAHCDASTLSPAYGLFDALPGQRLVSPISRHGPGFRRSVKPDIIFSGGRQLFYDFGEHLKFHLGGQAPGIKSAVPSNDGLSKVLYSRGSSNAAALVSNVAGRLYEMLLEIGTANAQQRIPDNAIAPMIKALLVHGARKDAEGKELIKELAAPARQCKELNSRFIGYGLPDIERVFRCVAQRATVLGVGQLKAQEANVECIHEFRLPLPLCLHRTQELRRLTVTLAWLTPVSIRVRDYRKAQLKVLIPNAEKLEELIGVDSGENEHNQIARGTVWHNVFEGKNVTDFVEGNELVLKVVCTKRGKHLDDEIPYGLVVSFETAENTDLPIYQEIRDRIRLQTRTRVRV